MNKMVLSGKQPGSYSWKMSQPQQLEIHIHNIVLQQIPVSLKANKERQTQPHLCVFDDGSRGAEKSERNL